MRRKQLWAVIAVMLVLSGSALAQVDPAAPDTGTAIGDTAPLPEDVAPADATADPLTDTGASMTSTDAVPGSATAPLSPLGDEDPSRLHMGLELETEAWLLPLVVFIAALLLGLVLHGVLVSHDVKNWPYTSGSWWKLRFWSLLLALALLIGTYFFFVNGLDEEALRIAGPRVRLWLYAYLLLVTIFWILPRPKFQRQTTERVEDHV
jgi:hypothetical protein